MEIILEYITRGLVEEILLNLLTFLVKYVIIYSGYINKGEKNG